MPPWLLERLRRERRCLICSAVYRPESLPAMRETELSAIICPSCRTALPRRESGYCSLCGEPGPWPGLPVAPCGRCLGKTPPWEGFLFHGAYTGLLRTMLIRLKFNDQILLSHVLGRLLAQHPGLDALSFDAVVPVPLHWERLYRRGYNQALELSRPLSKALRAPLRPGWLLRGRPTPPQTGFCRKGRKENMQGAFKAEKNVQDKRILLVDDVCTTGSTLEAAVNAMLQANAGGVWVMVAARAGLHGF